MINCTSKDFYLANTVILTKESNDLNDTIFKKIQCNIHFKGCTFDDYRLDFRNIEFEGHVHLGFDTLRIGFENCQFKKSFVIRTDYNVTTFKGCHFNVFDMETIYGFNEFVDCVFDRTLAGFDLGDTKQYLDENGSFDYELAFKWYYKPYCCVIDYNNRGDLPKLSFYRCSFDSYLNDIADLTISCNHETDQMSKLSLLKCDVNVRSEFMVSSNIFSFF